MIDSWSFTGPIYITCITINDHSKGCTTWACINLHVHTHWSSDGRDYHTRCNTLNTHTPMEQPLGAIWVPYPAHGHDMSTAGVWNQNTKLLISRWQLSLLTEPKAQLLIHTLVAMGWINFGFGYSVGFSIDNMSNERFEAPRYSIDNTVLKQRKAEKPDIWVASTNLL